MTRIEPIAVATISVQRIFSYMADEWLRILLLKDFFAKPIDRVNKKVNFSFELFNQSNEPIKYDISIR